MIHTAVEAPGEAPSITMIERSAELTSSVPNSRMPFVRLCSGALLRGDGREGRPALFYLLTAAVRARGLFRVMLCDGQNLRECFLAGVADELIVRHRNPPRRFARIIPLLRSRALIGSGKIRGNRFRYNPAVLSGRSESTIHGVSGGDR
jgi:hypothetical protein